MSTTELKPGTIVADPESGDNGQVLGSFIRNGERWWTVHWQKEGTIAHKESDIQ
mgnify:CR=1 FL=1|jgi:hypothetical protein|tara:strand:+ start:920 stop:1081 length:162 start_codon:yes stop_codon:yes gene_type:complete